ncbi:hypothetical protein MA16_Dca011558 [Dendrobium catenatum]|uniref:Uncharacterized protein n=1 Tax=Dendrobium catenatum TaxID=906689 RepID=A0A2I0W630_9ASPA|nr:hypothetical protein MA16_Dca011558 [Dendrobium catenatum]
MEATGHLKAWRGHIKAWRERGSGNGGNALFYRFELLLDMTAMTPTVVVVSLVEFAISLFKCDHFVIDLASTADTCECSPDGNPRSIKEFNYGCSSFIGYHVFMMSLTFAGEGWLAR